MIFKFNKIEKLIKRNTEISFLILLVFAAITSTTFYNSKKKIVNENYKDLINNIYFKKSINHIFNNLSPRYKIINHTVEQGEAFDKILKIYSVPDNEISKIKKTLDASYNLNSLKTKSIIKFTIDQSKKREIVSFLFPVSRTEKIYLVKNIETELFEKKNYNNRFK